MVTESIARQDAEALHIFREAARLTGLLEYDIGQATRGPRDYWASQGSKPALLISQ